MINCVIDIYILSPFFYDFLVEHLPIYIYIEVMYRIIIVYNCVSCVHVL